MKKVLATFKDYFIPHSGNDHRPHILRPRAVAFVAIVLVAAQAIFLFGISNLAPRSRLFGIILTNALIDGTNQNRVANNLPTLQENALLDAAAQEKANDMVANNYFAHTSPSGLSPWYWFEKVGYDFSSAGENLAVNFSDSEDVVNAWMNSPEHRANILDAGFTQIGMATAQGTYNGAPATYVVELFGTPAVPFSFVPPAEAAGGPATSAASPATPVAVKPKPVPAAIVSSSASSANANQMFITLNNVTTTASEAAPAVVPAPSVVPSAPSIVSNPIQTAAADPRHTVDDFYLLIAGIFIVALGLNTFIKIRIQHPQAIFGGVAILVIAALFIVFNQHFVLMHAVIL